MLRKSIQYLITNGHKISTLINSGSLESFIHSDVVRKLSISITKCTENVSMASASLTSKSLGYCFITFSLNGKVHNDVRVCVLNNL